MVLAPLILGGLFARALSSYLFRCYVLPFLLLVSSYETAHSTYIERHFRESSVKRASLGPSDMVGLVGVVCTKTRTCTSFFLTGLGTHQPEQHHHCFSSTFMQFNKHDAKRL